MTSCTTVSQEKIAYCDEKWTPAAAGLPEWRPTHAEIQAEMLQMDSFHQAGPTGAA